MGPGAKSRSGRITKRKGCVMDGVYRRGKIWYIDYYANGKRKREPAGENKKMAEAALRKRKTAVVEGKYFDMKKVEKIRFGDFADEYLRIHSSGNRSCHKDKLNMNMLKSTFGDKYLHEISPLDIQRFKAERSAEVSAATTNRGLALLKSMFNRGIEWQKIEESPCKNVKLFKENNQVLRYLEPEEIRRLLDNCTGYLKGIVTTALFTGMRKGEILSLKWSECDFERRMIRITNTKNNEARIIPMNDLLKETLSAMPRHRKSPYIFYRYNGQPFINVRKSFDKLLKTCKIDKFRFHDMRHTYASQLAMAGIDLNTIRELLGHKSLQMTLRYAHLSPDHKRKAVDSLNRLVTNWSQKPSDEEIENSTVSQPVENK